MELPTRESHKRQPHTLVRKSGRFRCSRGNKVNLLRSVKSCSNAPLLCCLLQCPWQEAQETALDMSAGEMLDLLPSSLRCSGLRKREICCCMSEFFQRANQKYQAGLQTWSLALSFPICFSLQLCLVSAQEIKFCINKKQSDKENLIICFMNSSGFQLVSVIL